MYTSIQRKQTTKFWPIGGHFIQVSLYHILSKEDYTASEFMLKCITHIIHNITVQFVTTCMIMNATLIAAAAFSAIASIQQAYPLHNIVICRCSVEHMVCLVSSVLFYLLDTFSLYWVTREFWNVFQINTNLSPANKHTNTTLNLIRLYYVPCKKECAVACTVFTCGKYT